MDKTRNIPPPLTVRFFPQNTQSLSWSKIPQTASPLTIIFSWSQGNRSPLFV
jgi:hypothetical protein